MTLTTTYRNKDISKLLSPSAVAVIGASTNPKSISGQPLAHMINCKYEGGLYPVNPQRSEVQGRKSYASVLDIPEQCDVAVIAVPRAHVPKALDDCGKAGIPFAVILTAGFIETGDDAGAAMQLELEQAIARSGACVVGPNCVGVMNVITRAYMAFGGALSDPALRPGPLAIVSQSGGFGQSMMTFANAQGIGSNYVISCGNETGLTFFDFAHDFLERDEVKMIATYMEATTAGHELRELGQHALRVGKPILMINVGNGAAGRRAASSHTGKLTADHTLLRATFQEGGFIEISDLDELADVARLVSAGKYPKGRRVCVFTGSGGWGVLMAEHCEKNGLSLPLPEAATQDKLRGLESTFSSVGNPIDMMANYGDQYKAIECVLDDPSFDMFMVRSASGPDVGIWTDRLIATAAKTDKPIIVNWSSSPTRDVDVRMRLENSGVLCAHFAGRAARAMAIFTDFALKRERHLQAKDSPRPIAPQDLALPSRGGALSEQQSKASVARYGIRTTQEVLLSLAEIHALTSAPLQFPVAVKLASPDIPHKTEAQAVLLNIQSLAALKTAAQTVHDNGLRYAPGARIDGVSIQEMASGIEFIIGAVNDPQFGPYIMVGLGGIFTEVLGDVAHRFAPVSPAEAETMVGALRGAAMLDGVRGQAPADRAALIHAIVRLSWLITDHADDISEIDLNPIFIGPVGQGITVADALIVTPTLTPTA